MGVRAAGSDPTCALSQDQQLTAARGARGRSATVRGVAESCGKVIKIPERITETHMFTLPKNCRSAREAHAQTRRRDQGMDPDSCSEQRCNATPRLRPHMQERGPPGLRIPGGDPRCLQHPSVKRLTPSWSCQRAARRSPEACLRSSARRDQQRRRPPAHCVGVSAWPNATTEIRMEKHLRVRQIVVVTSGPKREMVRKIKIWPTAPIAAKAAMWGRICGASRKKRSASSSSPPRSSPSGPGSTRSAWARRGDDSASAGSRPALLACLRRTRRRASRRGARCSMRSCST